MKKIGILLFRRISAAFLFSILFLILLSSCSDSAGDLSRFNQVERNFAEIKPGWLSVAENEFFELKLNGETAAFELFDKRTKKSWFSNPQAEDPLASGINKEYLLSQLRISYFNDRSIKKTMNSYADAVQNGQFTIRKTDTGAAVTYTLGEVDDIELFPQAISAERFESFYAKITEKKYLSQLDRHYKKIDLEVLATETLKQEYLEEYPQLKDGPFYEFSGLDNKAVRERIELGFIQAGYTINDLQQDNAFNNIEGAEPNIELFTFTIYYDLAGDKFIVRVPTEEIYFHPTYPLTYLRVLEFFAASREGAAEEGYLFVPDASGALIEFDSGKSNVDMYYGKVYGNDPAVPLKVRSMKQLPVLLPVFGMKQNENAFLAVIEEGDAHASIYADVSGRINSYNYVGSEFLILPFAPVSLESLQGNKFVNTYQQEPFEGEIRISYSFLSGDRADYCGMADRYSAMLFEESPTGAGLTKDAPEVLLDVYMAIDKRKHFLGIPYQGLEVLTTYEDVMAIMRDLDERNINNRILNLVGWEKGGVSHDARLAAESKLGSRRKRNALIERAARSGDALFFDGSVTRVLTNSAWDGFSKNFHTVQLLDRKDAMLYPFGLSTGAEEAFLPPYYLVGPKRGKKFFRQAQKRVQAYDLPGFAFRFAGTYLHSDFDEQNQIPRQQSLDLTVDLFKGVKENGTNLLVRSGNAYSLTLADVINDLPLSSNDYIITDRSVPFVQLVLSGHRYYGSKALNLLDWERSTFLKLVETGTIPNFAIIKGDNSLVVESFHNYLYAVNYDKLADTIQAWTSELTALRSASGNSELVHHSFLDDDVVLVEYAGGTKVVVNYRRKPYQYNNTLIEGEDYSIVQ